MYILSVCDTELSLKIIYFVKLFLNLIFFIVPIILIIKISLDLYKGLIGSEKDDIKKILKNVGIKFGAAVILFLVMPIVNAIFSIDAIKHTEYIECWNKVTNLKDIENASKTVYLNVNQSEIKGSTKLNCFGTSSCTVTLPTAYRSSVVSFLGWSESKECTNLINGTYQVTIKETNLFACYSDYKPNITPPTPNNDNQGGESGNNPQLVGTNYTIYVGDSRTYAMCTYLKSKMSNTEYCVAEVGKSLKWFQNTAIGKVDNYLNKHSDKVFNIVIDLSVNGIRGIKGESYAAEYNKLKEGKWSKHNIIITSVTPVREGSNADSLSNSSIEKFNINLKSSLDTSIKYCDIYPQMKSLVEAGGTIEKDGIHYTYNGSKSLYELKKSCLP